MLHWCMAEEGRKKREDCIGKKKKSEVWMSPAAELRLVGIRTQGD